MLLGQALRDAARMAHLAGIFQGRTWVMLPGMFMSTA